MPKNLTSLFKRTIIDKNNQKNIRKNLGADIACYVLITCTSPSKSGNMEVDLVYEGDKEIAAYLIHSAQGILDD